MIPLLPLLFFYFPASPSYATSIWEGAQRNKTFVFLSGWPQSGTSLLQQIMEEAKFASTMIQKCSRVYGKKCTNWNNEGQWLLKQPTALAAGVMCPLQDTLNSTHIQSIRDQVRN